MPVKNPNGWKTFNAGVTHFHLKGARKTHPVKRDKNINMMSCFYQLADPNKPWTKFNSCYAKVLLSIDDEHVEIVGVLPKQVPGMFVGMRNDSPREFSIRDETGYEMKGIGLVFRCDEERGYYMFDFRLLGENTNEKNVIKLIDLILKTNGPMNLRKPPKRARISVAGGGEGGMPADKADDGAGAGEDDTEDDENEEEFEARQQKADELQAALAKARADQVLSTTAVEEVTALRVEQKSALDAAKEDGVQLQLAIERVNHTRAKVEDAKQAVLDAIDRAERADTDARNADDKAGRSKKRAATIGEKLAAAEAAAKLALEKSNASEAEACAIANKITEEALIKAAAGAGPVAGALMPVSSGRLDALADAAAVHAAADGGGAPAPAPAPYLHIYVKPEVVDLTEDAD